MRNRSDEEGAEKEFDERDAVAPDVPASQPSDLEPALRQTEEGLSRLRPAPSGIDPAVVLFEAGRVAGRAEAGRQLFAWRAAAAVLLAGLGAVWFARAQPGTLVRGPVAAVHPRETTPAATTDHASAQAEPAPGQPPLAINPPERGGPRHSLADAWLAMVSVARETPEPESEPFAAEPSNYIALRDAVLRSGLGALPAARQTSATIDAPPTVESLLGLPPADGAAREHGVRPRKFFLFGENL